MRGNLRHDARRDANEPDLVAAFRRLGGVWYSAGPLDGWAWISGEWTPVEIKLPHLKGRKDEFTPAQREFMAECALNRMQYSIWRTEGDVVAFLDRFRCGRS